MCTLLVLFRPGHRWPVLAAANRDEMLDRPWAPPGRHWPDRRDVVGGLDRLSGGTWIGINDHGVLAAVLNRPGSLGPVTDKRSRGELPLEALDHADADAAALALSELDPAAYRPFNMAVIDSDGGYWLASRGAGGPGVIEVRPLPPGYSMITAHDRNDRASPRIAHFLPRFEAAAVPDPERGDWSAWSAILADRSVPPGGEPRDAICLHGIDGFGTGSSALIALPAPGTGPARWLFAAGPPGTASYDTISV